MSSTTDSEILCDCLNGCPTIGHVDAYDCDPITLNYHEYDDNSRWDLKFDFFLKLNASTTLSPLRFTAQVPILCNYSDFSIITSESEILFRSNFTNLNDTTCTVSMIEYENDDHYYISLKELIPAEGDLSLTLLPNLPNIEIRYLNNGLNYTATLFSTCILPDQIDLLNTCSGEIVYSIPGLQDGTYPFVTNASCDFFRYEGELVEVIHVNKKETVLTVVMILIIAFSSLMVFLILLFLFRRKLKKKVRGKTR